MQNANVNAGGGYVEHGAQLYIVRGLGLIKNVDDIKNVAVATVNGTPILIKDIGQVDHRPRHAAGPGGPDGLRQRQSHQR